MKKASEAFVGLTSAWAEYIEFVKTNKNAEMNISQWGFDNVDIENIGIPWAGWEETIKLPDDSLDISFEKKLIQYFNSMRDRLNEAKNQNVGWLLNTSSFLNDVAEINQIIFVLIPAIRGISSEFKNFNVAAEKIAAIEFKNNLSNIKETLSEIESKKSLVISAAGKVDQQSAALDAAAISLEMASAKLAKATADLNKQGLAGAFSDAAIKFNGQRKLFGGGFLLSIILLVALGYDNRVALSSIGTDFKFIGVVLSASPWVWLGWFCVRQLGQMTRVQQDYEFKTATALAFEAHKREISTSDQVDIEMSKIFIKTVIQNFGENPVRLLPDSKNEHGHPIEGLISKITDEKILDKLIKALESLKNR